MTRTAKYKAKSNEVFFTKFTNKVIAAAMIALGLFVSAYTKEGSALMCLMVFAVPLFFSKKNIMSYYK